MKAHVARALDRLRSASDPSLGELARLTAQEATQAHLRDVLPARWVATQVAATIEALGDGTALRQTLAMRLSDTRTRWSGDPRPLRDVLPAEAAAPIEALLTRPYVPDEALTYRLIQHPALSNLVRDVLSDTVTGFRKRMSTVDEGLLGGLGGRAAKRGRTFLGGLGSGLNTGLGGLAGDLVHTVREEVEHSLDGRMREFITSATEDTVRYIARYLADPQHADLLGSMRVSIFEVLLDTPVHELLQELDKLAPEEAAATVLDALQQSAASPDFIDRLAGRLESVQREVGDGTLGDLLDEVGLREVWLETTTELIRARLQAVVVTEGFADWWGQLFEG